jgi:hypothetical protein
MEQQRAVHESPKRMWASKLTLRIISTVLDLILIGVSASLGTNWSSPAIIFFLPPACVAFVWNVAEGISILARGGRRGIHPGACVGVDLILWLGFLVASVMYILFGYGWYFYTYGDIYFTDSDILGTSASTYATLNRACLAFGFMEVILHFSLFVIACVETSRRNQASTVVVYQPPPGMMVAPGYYPQQMVYQPDQYNQHPHQSMIIPASYQPPPQGYQGPGMYQQQGPHGQTRDPNKFEADSTPVSVPSPAYDGQPERRA